MKNSSPSVGQQIREARKLASLTLELLAQRIGISNQALSAIERGKTNPSRQTLISLAKTLENDFGEPWLRKIITEQDQASRIRDWPNLDEMFKAIMGYTFEEAVEAHEATKLPRPVRVASEKTVHVPIHYRINNGLALSPCVSNEYVTVPFSMVPSLLKACAVMVTEEPLSEAYLGPGDIIVLTECSNPENGKPVLTVVDNRVSIGRWILKARRVTLQPHNPNYDAIRVPFNRIQCLGEITGVIRLFK
jgi:transcriptional regulator with XRE-family HTH domain